MIDLEERLLVLEMAGMRGVGAKGGAGRRAAQTPIEHRPLWHPGAPNAVGCVVVVVILVVVVIIVVVVVVIVVVVVTVAGAAGRRAPSVASPAQDGRRQNRPRAVYPTSCPGTSRAGSTSSPRVRRATRRSTTRFARSPRCRSRCG